MQTVNRSACIKHRGHNWRSIRILSKVQLKRRPWLLAKSVLRRRPGKPATLDQGFRHTKHTRLARLIQVQTTRVLASSDTQRINPPIIDLPSRRIRKPKLTPPVRRIQVVMNRLVTRRDILKPTRAALACVEAKRAHCQDQKTRRGDQSDRQCAPSRVPSHGERRQALQREAPVNLASICAETV